MSDTWNDAEAEVDFPPEPESDPVADRPSDLPNDVEGEPDDWSRLSPRKLFIDPIAVLRGFAVPLIAIAVGLGTSDRPWLTLLAFPAAVLVAIALGTLPWLTTFFRVDAHQFQQRTGLLNKKTSTASLDRIRSVDLEASLLHRMLGLRKVQIGTGVDDERIVLDAVTLEQANALRTMLLNRTALRNTPSQASQAAREGHTVLGPLDHPVADGPPTAYDPTSAPVASADAQVLATLDPTWVRFAPFSLTRLVIVAGAVGFMSQFADDLPFLDPNHLDDFWSWVTGFAVFLVAIVVFLMALMGWVVIAMAGYVAQWWGLRVTRERGSLHQTSGLFTTKSVTVEEQRVRGVELKETVLLRTVRGAELSTLSTGLANGVTSILPPCPTTVATAVASEIVEDAAPMSTPLQEHGPAARRRIHLRRQWPTWFLIAAFIATVNVEFLDVVHDWLPSWAAVGAIVASALIGVVMAEATYAHLGHALTERHLVVGSGSSTRVRTVLEQDGIIGWVVKESFFQRRRGLATLISTTAAGAEEVVLRDIPHDRALVLAHTATPGVFSPFLA